MGKYYGLVGFATQQKTGPGVWENVIVEHPYSGEILDNRWRTGSGSNTNSELTLNCDFSLLCDPYMIEHHAFAAYITYMGTKWEVTGAVPNYPRVVFTVGGVYNENSSGSSKFSGETTE